MKMVGSGTALLLAGVSFFAYDFYDFRRSIVRNLGIQAEIIGSNSVSAVLFDDSHSAENPLSALRAAPHVMFAEIYTPDGRAFAGYRRDRDESFAPAPAIPDGGAQVYPFERGQVALARLIVFRGKPVATISIRSDLQAVNDLERNFAFIVATVLFMSLLAALWISSVARRSIAEPIMRLAETARIILSERNYSIRASTNGERNEVAVLISTFNEMLGQIQERDAALGKARDHLEQQVQERTAQLDAANKELEAFSYSVSHDLRAPLRAIDGFSKAILDEYSETLDKQARHYLERVRTGIRKMSGLIDDLLNLSRMSRAVLRKESIDLTVLAREIVADLQDREPFR